MYQLVSAHLSGLDDYERGKLCGRILGEVVIEVGLAAATGGLVLATKGATMTRVLNKVRPLLEARGVPAAKIDEIAAFFNRLDTDAPEPRVTRTVFGGAGAWQTLEEYDWDFSLGGADAFALAARFAHGPAIDDPLWVERDVSPADGTPETYIFLTDHQGSVVALVRNLLIVERYRYTDFGLPRIFNATDSTERPDIQRYHDRDHLPDHRKRAARAVERLTVMRNANPNT